MTTQMKKIQEITKNLLKKININKILNLIYLKEIKILKISLNTTFRIFNT